MSTRDVADQLWGSVPSTAPLRPQDIANLGAPPRVIDSRMVAYSQRAVSSLAAFWLCCAILFSAGRVMMFFLDARSHTLGELARNPPILPVVFIGLTIYSFRWRSRARQSVLETLRTGTMLRALITDMRAVERRGKYGRVLYVTYYVTFQMPSGPVILVSRDPGVSILQVGLSEEVVWESRNPNVVIPTYLLV